MCCFKFVSVIQNVRQPGIEPGSIACKATMLTFTPPTLYVFDGYFRTRVWKEVDYTYNDMLNRYEC